MTSIQGSRLGVRFGSRVQPSALGFRVVRLLGLIQRRLQHPRFWTSSSGFRAEVEEKKKEREKERKEERKKAGLVGSMEYAAWGLRCWVC